MADGVGIAPTSPLKGEPVFETGATSLYSPAIQSAAGRICTRIDPLRTRLPESVRATAADESGPGPR